jgi:putative zinc finger/helix-turn-helix YgiT family protein
MTEFDVAERPDTFSIRGEDVTVDARVAVCRTCGGEIGCGEFDDATFKAAYAVYRSRHGLLQPEAIKAIRSKYGLGQKAFARLLGWGDVTLARYEVGSLQSGSHDAALKLAEDPLNIRRLLQQNGDRLSEDQRAALLSRLDQLPAEQGNVLVREDAATYGTRSGLRKLGEMMVHFAERPAMWRTRLNKLLFYADFLHFKRFGVSISDARYVNMQYGPVPADFYALQAALVDDTSLDERLGGVGDCSATVFVANRPADCSLFSADELRTLDDVVRKFDGWSASQIAEFSHREPAWTETGDRDTIGYEFAERLQLS